MALFEQIGKRIADVGQGVAQQTKNFAEVTRLNSSISEREKKIAQIYSAIGQAYYERHKDDTAAEDLEKIVEIKALLSEIGQFREEIVRIKGIASCPVCGAEVNSDAVFCNSCGAKLPQASPVAGETSENAKLCPNCNKPVSEGNLFCTFCGTKL